ncbi:MAG TPA: DUF6282 family protein [Methanothermobacter sp.]|nr:conserved hypothetical protein [Methanothermobacter sp. MT-2]HOK72365.1 DUF6282 family protein [Methanothermobacter sp.]HOL69232.1 DUF6282 family protein [Methanothermobacter sp.]HPQ03852.1 DUF6282 family protein [Methanothermobacter sp.]HPU37554.1 DUF6282 family protein [Methanothermobacter sp.]
MKKSKISLEDMIDTHIHPAPDNIPRLLDDIEVAKQASIENMRAIVIKNHFESTASRALIASKVAGMDVIGGVTLNESVGGLNPSVVEFSVKLGGRFVWMPTISREKIDLTNINEILDIIAEHDLILATGHLKPYEILEVMDLARSAGIKRMLINHPLTRVVGASLEEQREMAKHAFIEHCIVACFHEGLSIERIIEAIEYVGYKRCIIATDLGQEDNPSPVEGFKWFIGSLIQNGLKEKHINWMCSAAPNKLIF